MSLKPENEQEQRGSSGDGVPPTAVREEPVHSEPANFVTVALGEESRREWAECELEPPTQSYSDRLCYCLRLTPAIGQLGCICAAWARHCFRGAGPEDPAEKL